MLIVETHDFMVPGTTDRLRARFAATHEVEVLRPESLRVPPGALSFLSQSERETALDEMRVGQNSWLVMRPRARCPASLPDSPA
jgi:hypothetical protein